MGSTLDPMNVYRTTALLQTSGGDVFFMPYREVEASFIVSDIAQMTTRIMTMDKIEEEYDIYPEIKAAMVSLFEINAEDDGMLTDKEYDAVTTLKAVFERKIQSHITNKTRKADKRYESFRTDKVHFKPDELVWAATDRCVCGRGMAYPRECGSNRQWECSGILTGEGDTKLLHLSPRPFAFYNIKSDCQPSANGATTREPIEPLSEAYPKGPTPPMNRRCDGCGTVVDVSNGGSHEGCDHVYGRRGWRQLGAYDG